MASIIKIKRSDTQGSVPSGLQVGEIAVNLFDRKLYVGNTAGGVSAIGGEDFRLTTQSAGDGAYLKLLGDSTLSTNTVLMRAGSGISITKEGNGSISFAATGEATANEAQRLSTPRRISLGGDVSGWADFDGSANVTIAATIADDSHNHIISNIDGLQTALDTKATWSALTSTNTAIRSLVSDRLQVANATSTFATKATVASNLANTNARIATAEANIAQKLGAGASVTLTGDVTGTASFSGNSVSITTTYNNDVVLGTDTSGNYAAAVTGTTNEIEVTGSAGEGTTFQIGLPNSVVISNNLSMGGSLTIDGDLIVAGNTTTVSSNNLSVTDNFIYLNDGGGNTNIDMGWAGGYNAGGYAHAGIFRDATDGRFKVFHGYEPEPDASTNIDTTHASFGLADFAANNFIGDLTGNADTATSAAALTTARTIGLSGDVSGSVSFDGSQDVTITATIADDSHNHVIGNVDGLQSALDTKATWSALTATNTSIRLAVSDRLQVANAAATYATRTTVNSNLANTNAYIATKANSSTVASNLANTNAWIDNVESNLLSTNTALRSAISAIETNVDQKLGATASVTLQGDISGSANFSGNTVTITTTYNNDVVLGTDTSGNYVSGISGTANEIEVTGSGSEGAAVTIGLPNDVTVGNDLTVTNDLRVQGDTTIDGNLTVEGALTYISTSTVYADDGMFKLAANNSGDAVDTGIYGMYVDGATTRYAGYFRDATDGAFKFYANTTVEPTTSVDTAGTGYNLAQIDAVIDGGTY
jgi:mannitol/fructose-specific phosphotransferase system IIA component